MSIIIRGVQSGGINNFLSSLSFRLASILSEAKFLFACLWSLEIALEGQCYLLLFEGVVVFLILIRV